MLFNHIYCFMDHVSDENVQICPYMEENHLSFILIGLIELNMNFKKNCIPSLNTMLHPPVFI